jgi:hypothetical protein
MCATARWLLGRSDRGYAPYSPKVGKNNRERRGRRALMTLVRVNETNSGSGFLIYNLQMVTRVEGRNFKDEQEKHQQTRTQTL